MELNYFLGVMIEGMRVMKDISFERKLQELVAEFGASRDPRYDKLTKIAEQAKNNQQQLQKSVNKLQESLDYLRICIKYQLFDLEATRRENKYLRKLLEEQD